MDGVFGSGSDLAEFDGEGFVPKVLYETDRIKVVLAALEPGQEIPLHAPGVDLAVAVLEGTGEVWVDDRRHAVVPGDVAVVPAGTTRGVRARGGRLVLLHVVSPPPTAADHRQTRSPWPAETPGPDVRTSLHEEHEELLPHLDHVRALAGEVGGLDDDALRTRLQGVLGFLTEALLPHAGVEEDALYPAIDRLLVAAGHGTATMSIDHREMGERIEALGRMAKEPVTLESRVAIGRALGELEAIVRLHFRKEEEAYLPLLDRLSPDEATALVGALAAAGHGNHHEH